MRDGHTADGLLRPDLELHRTYSGSTLTTTTGMPPLSRISFTSSSRDSTWPQRQPGDTFCVTYVLSSIVLAMHPRPEHPACISGGIVSRFCTEAAYSILGTLCVSASR